jgi:isoleucyl-tRNA synthetase
MSDESPKEKSPLPDYKGSIRLPSTPFPMKADLPRREPERLEKWKKEKLYEAIRAARKGAPKFVFHDGPPYANSDLHLGHALNHSLKDFVVKSRTMMGYDTRFRPGWDCHGLPIEQRVEKAVGRAKLKSMTPREIRGLSRAHAEKVIARQSAGIQRLGVLGEFGTPYITMDFGYEAGVVRTFGKIYGKGLAYKALKSVHWCGSCHTALAEAEIEYEQKVDPSIYAAFPIVKAEGVDTEQLFAIIWTTTPWTLPANRAIAVHPDEEYLVIQPAGDKRKFLIAAKLREKLATVFDWAHGGKVIADGLHYKQLKEWKFRHPLAPDSDAAYDQPFVPADYVEMDTGTGLVHTAPGHGIDDYITGVKHGLEIACPVDEFGFLRKLYPTVPDEVVGKSIWDANPIIIELLKARGGLLIEGKLDHSYPCCWRCRNKLFFRATPQWFIAMDKPLPDAAGASLRSLALDAIDGVNQTGGWIPAWGYERIRNMIAARPDWCVSRQRLWGVPITVFYCTNEKCEHKPYATPESFEKIAAQFERVGCDGWFEKSAAEFLPAGAHCAGCGGNEFEKETDILDVWFDSGSSHRLALDPPAAGAAWADLYLEGSDQHRGWFHTSLLIGCAIDERAPFRSVLTHGFTLDGEGRPMSKSLGNGIDPEEINSKYGAEVLRLWVAASDYGSDIRLSPAMLTQHAESYRKIRNTLRYMLGALEGFDPGADCVDFASLQFPDRYLLLKARKLFDQAARDYERYQFHAISRELNNFVVVTLSNFFLTIQKDTLYIRPPADARRRSAQTALYIVARALIKAVAPLMPFTADEAWAMLPAWPGKPASVHLANFDGAGNLAGNGADPTDRLKTVPLLDEAEARGDQLLFLRDKVLKALETERAAGRIGDGLEAVLYLEAREPALRALLDPLGADALQWFGVSELHRQPLSGRPHSFSDPDLDIWVVNADVAPCHAHHSKCARCWWRTADVAAAGPYPGVCARCAGFLAEMKWPAV